MKRFTKLIFFPLSADYFLYLTNYFFYVILRNFSEYRNIKY